MRYGSVMRSYILLFSLFLLSGCAFGHLERLQLLNPEAHDFQSALAAEYLAYADAESEQGRSLSAEYFADKGLDAWMGRTVPLEPVEDFLPKAAQSRLAAARDMLEILLTDDIKRVVPQQAARAQLLFDCWAKQEGQRKKDAPACAEELQPALTELQTVATSFSLGSETVHTVMFSSGKSALSKQAQTVIQGVAKQVSGKTAYVIVLEGYTGSNSAKRLFEARAAGLRKALSARGIMDDSIRIKNAVSAQAVYLSCDETVRDKNAVRVTVQVFGRHEKASDSH